MSVPLALGSSRPGLCGSENYHKHKRYRWICHDQLIPNGQWRFPSSSVPVCIYGLGLLAMRNPSGVLCKMVYNGAARLLLISTAKPALISKTMMSFLSLSSFAALAVTCYAFVAPDSALQKRGVCTDGSITSHSTVAVGDKIVEVSTVSCPASVASRSLTKRQSEGLLDVCDAICSDSCNNDSGDLPPEADDCDTIVDAITILNGSISPTFTVDSGDMQQLTYGTCRYYFENLSNETLEYCWTALSDMGSAAGAACFPPTEPVYSEGVCQATTGLWVVGAAHS